MLQTKLITSTTRICRPANLLASSSLPRSFSHSSRLLNTIPVQIHGVGTGTEQTISVAHKPVDTHAFRADTYPALGGADSAPSPVAYCLASLSSCNQVTGSVVARDHGIRLGQWDIAITGDLPTNVLVRGDKEGNPNWEAVKVLVRVQTDISGEGGERWKYFVSEVERRCPITQLFKLSGVRFESEWLNERL